MKNEDGALAGIRTRAVFYNSNHPSKTVSKLVSFKTTTDTKFPNALVMSVFKMRPLSIGLQVLMS